MYSPTEKGRVAFLGGSITEASGWRNHASDSLQKRFPDTEFEFVYAGIGSTDSTYGAYRLHRDILSKGKIDLLFIESAVNELHNWRTRDDISKAVEGIILQARRHNPDIDIIAQYLYDMPYVESYRKGITPWQIAALDRISLQYGINAIDQARQVTKWFESGEFSQQTFGGCHPKPAGHQAYASMIDRLFDRAWAGPVAGQLVPHKSGRRYDARSYDQAGLHPLSLAQVQNGMETWWKTGRVLARVVFANMTRVWITSRRLSRVRNLPWSFQVPRLVSPWWRDRMWVSSSGRVDGGEWKSLDQFTKWSRGLHIPWIYMLEKELPLGEHTLTLRTTDQKNENSIGYACRFSAFAINGNND